MTKDQVNVRAGFLPLMDSALLILAEEKGFTASEGICFELIRETSWANIRDKVAVGHFDIAHMLAPMPIASNLHLNPVSAPMIAPMALGLGGNAVTVSPDLWSRMQSEAVSDPVDARAVGESLRRVVAKRAGAPLKLGVVHPHSGHNYELRYWLAGCGIAPDRDVEIVVMPPSLLPDALSQGGLDGFCVGEPWNSVAVSRGDGVIATVKPSIWRSSPEKVLGTTLQWADANPDAMQATIRAIYSAAKWLEVADNLAEAADILSRDRYLSQPADLILRGLSGRLVLGSNRTEQILDNFFVPHALAATFPWHSHALWFYTQMVRWSQIGHSPANARVAQQSYRPDLYRKALRDFADSLPGANSKVEGALVEPTLVGASGGNLVLGPDGFFDGLVFDPDNLDSYLASQRGANSA